MNIFMCKKLCCVSAAWKWDNVKFHHCLHVGRFVCTYDSFYAIYLYKLSGLDS